MYTHARSARLLTVLCLTLSLAATGCTVAPDQVGGPTDGTDTTDPQGLTPPVVLLDAEPPGENCPAGGTSIRAGLDTDLDGTLGDSEITDTHYVCNGAAGTDGTDGADGADGAKGDQGDPGEAGAAGLDGVQGVQGDQGDPGEKGEAGDAGAPGTVALVALTEELPGDICADGGVRVDAGLDLDGDGELGDGEVSATEYVCNGAAGVDGLQGDQGPAGQAGQDGAQGDPGQDGQDGAQGDPGQDGQNGAQGDPGQDGQDGQDGADGHSAVVTTTREPLGDNCASGGDRIDIGVDDNENGELDPEEIDATLYACNEPGTVGLVGDPDPSTVFDSPEVCYHYDNNLVGGIWDPDSDRLLAGHFSSHGYYSHPAGQGDYPAVPDNDVQTDYARMVNMPGSGVIVIAGTDQRAAPANTVSVAALQDGHIVDRVDAVWSDGFEGNCNLISSSMTEFLCFDGTTIRHYETVAGDTTLTLSLEVELSAVEFRDCSTHCFGGRFAWDGLYYYFPSDGASSGNEDYMVFDSEGVFVAEHTAAGGRGISGLYFDWAVARYTTHDGYGNRHSADGEDYTWVNGELGDDSQCYGPISPDHVAP